MAPHSQPQTQQPYTFSQEVYGFARYIFAFLLLMLYLVLSITPNSLLEHYGVVFYPHKYWFLAIPSLIIYIVVFLIFNYIVFNFRNTHSPYENDMFFRDNLTRRIRNEDIFDSRVLYHENVNINQNSPQNSPQNSSQNNSNYNPKINFSSGQNRIKTTNSDDSDNEMDHIDENDQWSRNGGLHQRSASGVLNSSKKAAKMTKMTKTTKTTTKNPSDKITNTSNNTPLSTLPPTSLTSNEAFGSDSSTSSLILPTENHNENNHNNDQNSHNSRNDQNNQNNRKISHHPPRIVEIYNSLDINPDKVNPIDPRPILESYDLAPTLVSEYLTRDL
jgi:hypothetical protein